MSSYLSSLLPNVYSLLVENRRFDGSSFDRQTDRHQPSETDWLATTHFFLLSSSFSISYIQSFLSISFSFFLFLSPHARTIFCSSRTRLSRAQRNLRSLPWHCTKTIIRFNTRTHVTRATINFIHLTTFLLLFSSPPSSLSFILSPVFFSSIGMPLTSFNLLGLACFNRTIIGLRVSRRINKDLWSNYENRYGI